MRPIIACCLTLAVALAQPPEHDQEPIDAAIKASLKARNERRFDEATTFREEARGLLIRVPADAPRFAAWVTTVANLYQGVGLTGKARTVVEEGLARAEALGEAHPARIQLLTSLAMYWQQDRNLLKAVACLEKAAAALPPTPTLPAASPYRAREAGIVIRAERPPGSDRMNVYRSSLADLYRQVGRREAADALAAKLAAEERDKSAVARIYEGQGRMEDALEMHKKQVENAAADPQSQPWGLPNALQALADFHEREKHYTEAITVLQQAIDAAMRTPRPELAIQSFWMRQRLAGLYARTGDTEAADRLYQELLAESRQKPEASQLQVVTSYANHLAETKRAPEAEDLLKDYLASRSDWNPGDESQILSSLATIERRAGNRERADQYQRAAVEKHPVARRGDEQSTIAKDLQDALAQANAGDVDAAFNLAMQNLDRAADASGGIQAAWQIPAIASALARKKAADKAEQLYQRLLGIAETWPENSHDFQAQALRGYAEFLIQQPGRWREAGAAIDRFRDALITVHGPGTGRLTEALDLTIQFEQRRGAPEKAIAAAQDGLALEESLSGTASEPYYHSVERLAGLYATVGDFARALPLRRKMITVADAAFTANDARRGYARVNLAMALARDRQFEEAERLADEAARLGKDFAQTRDQIRRMRAP